jgi:hypothetical protein
MTVERSKAESPERRSGRSGLKAMGTFRRGLAHRPVVHGVPQGGLQPDLPQVRGVGCSRTPSRGEGGRPPTHRPSQHPAQADILLCL